MSVLDTSAGFRIRGRLSGGPIHYQDILAQDTATYTKGDIVNVETGLLDLGAAADTALIGPVMETVSATASTTKVRVATDPDIILEVYDANARVVGATLDLSGATGAMTITSSSQKDFVVYETSTATEPTLLIFNQGHHLFRADQ
jgi:hypothetical protein